MTNPSLQKKTAARVASVQCLYNTAVTGDTPAPGEQVASLKAQLANNRNEQKLLVGLAIEPQYPMVEAVLSGVEQYRDEINLRLDGVLKEGWKRERLSPLLIAILQAAIFEMFFYKDTSAKIVTDEYTNLTRRFLGDGEVNFVHGALSELAKQYHG
jgi:transcription antitermination factor NusB